MKRLLAFGAVIALGLACGGDEGDGAVFIVAGGDPDCGPDNLIVYVGFDGIYYCDEYGRNERKVTDIPDQGESNPCWAPDGNSIAFDSYERETSLRQIYVVNKDGGGARRLTTTGGDYPVWSPDGNWIAFMKYPGDIWMVPAEGGEAKRLTVSGNCITPCWSNDGERIYFAGPDPKEPGGPCSLWYVNPDSLKVARVWTSGEEFRDLAVSPDGEWLAARLYKGSAPYDIWLLNIKTAKTYRVTDETEPSEEFPRLGAFSPTWRRDGVRLFFSSDRSPSGIYGIDIES